MKPIKTTSSSKTLYSFLPERSMECDKNIHPESQVYIEKTKTAIRLSKKNGEILEVSPDHMLGLIMAIAEFYCEIKHREKEAHVTLKIEIKESGL